MPQQRATRQALLGAWELVSAEYRGNDGTVAEYLGEHPEGMLVYTAGGLMSVHLMRRNRPRFATNDRLGGTPEQIKAAFQGYHGYYGTFSVDEREQSVTHHLQGASFPNWVGVDQKRFFHRAGNELTLRTVPLLLGGQEAVGYLVWRRR